MGRPRKFRKIRFRPRSNYFKPQGIPMRMLEEVVLGRDEMEAIRLCDLEELDMISAAEKMQVSKSTVHRLLGSAHKKIAEGLISGKAINIDQPDVSA